MWTTDPWTGQQVWEEDIDYENHPELAPPGSIWEGDQSSPDPNTIGNWSTPDGGTPQELTPNDRLPTAAGPTPAGDVDPTAPSGGSESGGGDWFSTNAPTEDYGAIPAPFGETYTALARPDYLQGEYVAPQWNETFQGPEKPELLRSAWRPPTMEEVMADPGYGTRMRSGVQSRDASAAARGSVLSGGHQKALERYGQEFGANEYAGAFSRGLESRNQVLGEYNTDHGNAFNQYQQRYGAFTDNAARGVQARQLNENAFQNDSGNNLNQYLTRYNAYRDSIGDRRNAETDYFDRNLALSGQGLTANGYLA